MAHIHVMIVHLPIMGTFLAMVPLLWGWYKKDVSIKWIGLVILAISLVGIPLATSSGEETQHAFYRGTISAELDNAGAEALSIHAQAAEAAEAFGFVVFCFIALQLFFWKREYSWKNRLFIITLILNIILIGGLGYVGYLGGQIRHPEFRTAVKSVDAPQANIAQ